MRFKERIPIILDHIIWYDFIEHLGCDNPQKIALKCEKSRNKIEKFWKSYPDFRLTQVLVSLEIVPNFPGSWFYVEEDEYMINNKMLKPEEIYFWGTYGKDGKDSLKIIALNDMEGSHIEAVLKTQKLTSEYRQIMKKLLRIRKLKSLKNE